MIHAGSLVSDASRKIAKIEYDYNNNPVRIQFTNGNVTKYIYSATGEKMRVIYQTAVANINVAIGETRELITNELVNKKEETVDYLLGGAFTLKNGRIDKYQFEEGYCQAKRYNNTMDDFTFCYYDQDHLGNIRQVTEADGTKKGAIIQKMNYYPFGAEFCDNGVKSYVQSRKYNGKEFDHMHGLNTYDYGARQYNPVTARWDRMDPLCEKHYDKKPYMYCANNPVRFLDPDGRDYYRSDDGAVFGQEGNANFVNSGGVKYRNIGETFSVYQSGIRYDYNQGQLTNVTDVNPEFNLEGGQYIPKSFVTDDGTKVGVTFKYTSSTGGNGDKALDSQAVSLLISGVNEANKDGANITSIDVSTTTTGKHSSNKSRHYVKNGAKAIDIDMVNNVPVKNSKSREKVNQLQKGIDKTGNAHQNIGPEIQIGVNRHVGGHDNHIHFDAL